VQGGSIGDEVIRRQIATATEIQATTPSLSSDVLTSSSSQPDDDATTTTWIDPSNAIDWNAVVFDEEMEALWRDSQGVAMKLFDVVG
jgi:hypothetical protein